MLVLDVKDDFQWNYYDNCLAFVNEIIPRYQPANFALKFI